MLGKQLKSIAKLSGLGRACSVLLLCALVPMPVAAMTYVLPERGDVIGQVQYAQVQAADTLATLARRYDVGYAQLRAANPEIDPERLEPGQRLVIPSRFILPPGPRRGIVVNLAEQRLYHYTDPEQGPALVSTYPISVGPEGGARTGRFTIEKRLRKPSWNVPAALQGGGLPAVIPPGPKNPLGEYAMQLANSAYMIHGTHAPQSIGRPVSRGSIRLYPEDMAVLVHRSVTDTPVRIINEPFKYGYKDGMLYFEVHKPAGARGSLNLAALVNKVTAIVPDTLWSTDWQRIRVTSEHARGMATPVANLRQAPAQSRAWQLQLATFQRYANARRLMLQLEELGVPAYADCDTGQCRVLAGPFRDVAYMRDLAKRIKWITRIKGITLPYRPEPDTLPDIPQTLAVAD